MGLAEKELVVMAGADDVKAALGEMGVVTTGMGIADYGDAIRSISVGCPALPDLVAGGTYKKQNGSPVVITPISGETTAIRLLVAATGPMKTALILTFTGSPTIDWGDGTTTSPTSNVAAVHQYDGVNPIPCGRPWGVYYITITGGAVTAIASSQSRDDWDGAIGNIVSVAVKSAAVTSISALLRSNAGLISNSLAEHLFFDCPVTSYMFLLYVSFGVRSMHLNNANPAPFTNFVYNVSVSSPLDACDLSQVKINGDFTATYYFANATSILFNPANTELGNVNIQYNSLSVAGFVALFNSLPTVSAKTIQIGGSAAALALTAEQLAIATNKGWTVTRSY